MRKAEMRTRLFHCISFLLLLVGMPAAAQWTPSGADIYNTNTGSVGIGTTLPATKLHVVGNTTIAGNIGIVTPTPPIARLQVGTMVSDNIESVSLSGDVRLPAYGNGIAYLQARDSSGNRSIGLQLRTQLSGAPVEAVKIDANGNLGIGTVAPTARLDVNGNVNVTGSITVSGNVNAKYQDLAEWVPSTQRLRPGNVVVLDRHNNNSVLAASVAYDTGVAGVVSPQPGVLLGEAGPEKLKVATTGRVRVRVDATSHPILIGDLLVTSNKTGAAMKSEAVIVSGIELHRPGTILGKALEPLEAGEGEILVLLSLQ